MTSMPLSSEYKNRIVLGTSELANSIRSEGDFVECSLILQITLQLLHMSKVISNKNVHLKTKQIKKKKKEYTRIFSGIYSRYRILSGGVLRLKNKASNHTIKLY